MASRGNWPLTLLLLRSSSKKKGKLVTSVGTEPAKPLELTWKNVSSGIWFSPKRDERGKAHPFLPVTLAPFKSTPATAVCLSVGYVAHRIPLKSHVSVPSTQFCV